MTHHPKLLDDERRRGRTQNAIWVRPVSGTEFRHIGEIIAPFVEQIETYQDETPPPPDGVAREALSTHPQPEASRAPNRRRLAAAVVRLYRLIRGD